MAKKIKKRTKKVEEPEDAIIEPALDDPEGVAGAEGLSDEEMDEVKNFGDIVVDIPEYERDAFEEASYKAANWVEDNRPVAIGLFIAVLLIPVAIYAAVHFSSQGEVESSSLVSAAIKEYTVPVKDSPQLKFLETNKNFKKPKKVYDTVEQKWQAVYDDADAALKKTAGSDLEVASKYAKAGAAYNLGKFDEAIALYNDVLKSDKGKALHVFALFSLAQAQSGAGKADDAIATLDKVAKDHTDQAAMAMYYKGRVLETAGKKEDAKKAYHKLLEDQPNTSYKSEVERRIATM